jgi:nucleoside-diphosphate-sugar epimerase
MWRPLVDVRDASDAMIAAYEAPAEIVRGEIFNVLHSNYQIRELALIVAGTVRLAGRSVDLTETEAPRSTTWGSARRSPTAPGPRTCAR